MKLNSAFAVLPFALVASARQQANYIGCFTSSGSLESQGSFEFQTVGYCLDSCDNADFKYAAVQKKDCFCGNTAPEQTDMTDDGECSSPCPGFANDNCGGRDAWSVYFGRNGSKPDWLSSSSIAVTSTSTEGATSTDSSTTSSITSASTSTSSERPTSSSGSLASANASNGPSASASTSSMDPTSTPNSASRRFNILF